MALEYVVPRHVAIIMDGNGRWATSRGKTRNFGHLQGAEALKQCIDSCIRLSVPYVTFYAFSTENWKRPKLEVDGLMKLMEKYLDEFVDIGKRNARLNFIGDTTAFSEKLQAKISAAKNLTKGNTGTVITVAINYGGRDEIFRAVKLALGEKLQPDTLTIEQYERLMESGDLPDVDLVIRTSGEQRISNFLLWKAAYAEYIFLDVLWPDFSEADLIDCFRQYSLKERRFGGI